MIAYVVSAQEIEMCPACVAALRSGTPRGPIGLDHDVPGIGPCRAVAELVRPEVLVSLAPCSGCGGVGTVLRRSVRLRLASLAIPAGYDPAYLDTCDPDVFWSDAGV